MKWFQHLTDSYSNPKTQILVAKYGWEGYGMLQVIREIIGRYGVHYKITKQKSWKTSLAKTLGKSPEEVQEFCEFLAEKNFIDRKALKRGHLHIPKMREYSDEYTKKLQRNSGGTPDNVRVDNITLHNIILYYIEEKGWKPAFDNNPSIRSDLIKRNCKAAKQLYLALNKDKELVIKAISCFAQYYRERALTWTLETILKNLPKFFEFQKGGKKVTSYHPALQKYLKSIGRTDD